jgi:hypothetical protein
MFISFSVFTFLVGFCFCQVLRNFEIGVCVVGMPSCPLSILVVPVVRCPSPSAGTTTGQPENFKMSFFLRS